MFTFSHRNFSGQAFGRSTPLPGLCSTCILIRTEGGVLKACPENAALFHMKNSVKIC